MFYRSLLLSAAVLLVALSLSVSVNAQSSSITYQGQLRDNGEPVTGTVNLRFQLFDALTGGNSIGDEKAFVGWPVEDGLFQVELDFAATAFDGSERYLEIEVNGAPLSPRQRVTAVPFALRAAQTAAGAVGSNEIDPSQVQLRITGGCPGGQYLQSVNPNGTVVCGADAPSWNLSGNASTNAATNFIGTTDGQALEFRTGNARSLRIEPSTELFEGVPVTVNVIAGSRGNAVAAGIRGATIAGGGVPEQGSDPDFFFGEPNQVNDDFGVIGGGYGNEAGASDTGFFSGFATVGGGRANIASGPYVTVGGGDFNTASGNGATVSGGDENEATSVWTTVAGGGMNTASGNSSVVSGGASNAASDTYAVVSGGSSNTASNDQSTVSGGESNTASGTRSTVAGGEDNSAVGIGAVVSGGENNCAGGWYSWAGGRGAKVRPDGSTELGEGCAGVEQRPGTNGDLGTFVWSGSFGFEPFVSTGPEQFLIDSPGGVGINYNAPDTELHVLGPSRANSSDFWQIIAEGSETTGASGTGSGISFFCHDGNIRRIWGYIENVKETSTTGSTRSRMSFYTRGSSGFPVEQMRIDADGDIANKNSTWVTLSDRRTKQDIRPLTGALDRLMGLKGVTFRYHEGLAPFGDTRQRMGFVAQQVEVVLPEWVSENGEGYKQLAPTGFRPLAVEAIRELRDEQNAAIVQLEQENALLRTRLAEVELQQNEKLTDLRAEIALLRELVAPRLAEADPQ